MAKPTKRGHQIQQIFQSLVLCAKQRMLLNGPICFCMDPCRSAATGSHPKERKQDIYCCILFTFTPDQNFVKAKRIHICCHTHSFVVSHKPTHEEDFALTTLFI